MDTPLDLVDTARLIGAFGADTAVLLACALAIARGERLLVTVAGMVAAARLLGLISAAAAGPLTALAIQTGLLLCLLTTAVLSRPYWVLFTAAFQLLIVVSCGAEMLTGWSGKLFVQACSVASAATLLVAGARGEASARDA